MTSRVLFRADRLAIEASGARPVLALDTGAAVASFALFADGRIVGERSTDTKSHGAGLPLTVAELLDEAGLRPSDLGAVAVGLGPGSFTGLRVGLSYAKGVVAGTGCAIVGVPTLDCIALGALEEIVRGDQTAETVCVLVDARKGEVYTALYRRVSDGLEKMSGDLVMPIAPLAADLPRGTMLAGDSTTNEAATFLANRALKALVADRMTFETRARMGALLGAARLSSGNSDPVQSLEPLYVRPPDARAGMPGRAVSLQEGLWSAERKNSSGCI